MKSKTRSVFAIIFLLFPSIVFSQTADIAEIDSALNGMIGLLSGHALTLIAILSIISMGYLWGIGKISLKMFATVAIGISVVAGAPSIATALGFDF